jgi:hypothetical protein
VNTKGRRQEKREEVERRVTQCFRRGLLPASRLLRNQNPRGTASPCPDQTPDQDPAYVSKVKNEFNAIDAAIMEI